ncbi:MAG TPA: XrtB/PEP-CTERM-associated polysaccharide biosynthesis outer membrane protein EpsL [Povalibacter sp.]|nr:XrtB/PEP-CTERM-associated polysaccharide biosynthesis outer membrane protein EpsL [Povalibacter sp.]
MSRHSRPDGRNDLRRWAGASTLLPVVFAAHLANAADAQLTAAEARDRAAEAQDPFKFTLADRYLYDDNLFRIPDGLLASDPSIARPKSLNDHVNRASAGMRIRLDASRQVFFADLRLDDVRYQRNDDLDHTGASADVRWDWQLGSRLSGKLTAQYDRAQASLANYRFFSKDIVDAQLYGAELRYAIGARWRLLAAGALMDTDHSAELRRVENFKSTSGRGGVEYVTPAGNLIALEYRSTDAKFPIAEDLAGAARGYNERVPGVRVEYDFTEKTRLKVRAGYLKREYDNPALADYSGTIADATVRWEPRSKIYFDLKAWHELKAYVDAESDYFVADGVSIAPTWEPTEKIQIAAQYSYESQDYQGDSLVLLPTPLERGRNDDVQTLQLGIDYTPRDLVTIGIAYRWTDRSSNRDFRGYDDNMISAQLKLNL